MHSYVVRPADNGKDRYVVGHWFTGNWYPLSAFRTLEDAAAWVSYLNGGTYPAKSEAVS